MGLTLSEGIIQVSEDQALERVIGHIEGTINGMKDDIKDIKTLNGQILKAVQSQALICATTVQKFGDMAETQIAIRTAITDNHEERLTGVEKKDSIGGTKLWEKALIIANSVFLLLKSVSDFISGG